MKYLIPLILCTLPFSTAAHANNHCHEYAKKAVTQHITNLKYECGYQGSRWNPHYLGQKAWCKTVRPAISNRENQVRQNKIKRCVLTKPRRLTWDQVPYFAKNAIIKAAIDTTKHDDVQALRIFKQQKTNLAHEWDGNFGTILYYAIDNQAPKAVKYLLQYDDPNRTPNGGINPLSNMVSDQSINYKLLTLLLKKGADPNLPGEQYQLQSLPLYEAIKKRDQKAIRILIQHGADPNIKMSMEYMLEVAIALKHAPTIRTLITQGAHVNLRDDICNIDEHGLRAHLPLDQVIALKKPKLAAFMRARGAKTISECNYPY